MAPLGRVAVGLPRGGSHEATAQSVTGPRRDSGATAVEFALVAPILLLLVFGIIEYGLWFSDSLATRQGVREAARQGVVAQLR